MLTHSGELVGHTIKAIVEYPDGTLAEPGSVVLVTETGCWAVFTVQGYSFEEASVGLDLKKQTGGHGLRPLRDLTLHDFLSARDMQSEGIIGDAEYQLLHKKEQEAKQADRLAKAEKLRQELARLEGGAA